MAFRENFLQPTVPVYSTGNVMTLNFRGNNGTRSRGLLATVSSVTGLYDLLQMSVSSVTGVCDLVKMSVSSLTGVCDLVKCLFHL